MILFMGKELTDSSQHSTLKTDPVIEGAECRKDDNYPSTLNLVTGQQRMGICSSPPLPASQTSPSRSSPHCLC